MASIEAIRKHYIALIKYSCETLGNIASTVPQEAAVTLRDRNDGDKGWTTVEVMCHLRDFDDIFYRRAQMMLATAVPQLPAFDHEAMAVDGAYNSQRLTDAFDQLASSRARFIDFFNGLSDEQWAASGIHPEKGLFTMTNALMQVAGHDAVHLEQITRILAQK